MVRPAGVRAARPSRCSSSSPGLLPVSSGEMLAVRQMSKIDDLARSLAERPSPAGTPDRSRAASSDPALDRIARVLAAPVSRRRVFRLGAAAAGASFFTLLPSRARAQAADDPCPTCASRRAACRAACG
jgi:hypothetical protein